MAEVEQLKETSKKQNTLKATQTWLKVCQNNWAKERKVNHNTKEYEHEKLGKMLKYFMPKYDC